MSISVLRTFTSLSILFKPDCPAAVSLLELLLDTHHGVDEGEDAAPDADHHHVPAVDPHPGGDWPEEDYIE